MCIKLLQWFLMASILFTSLSLSAQTMITGPVSVCYNDCETYSVPFTTNYSYAWMVIGGTYTQSANTIVVCWNNIGTGMITVTEFDNAVPGSTFTSDLTVIVNPLPTPSITPKNAACTGGMQSGGDPTGEGLRCVAACDSTKATYFTDLNAGSTYQWVVTGGTILGSSTLDSLCVYWTGVGTLGSVKVIETNMFGCVDSANVCIEVVPKPIAGFTTLPAASGGTINICMNQTVSFFDNSIGATILNWDFGDPTSGANNTSNLSNPTHTYNMAGSFIATLIAENDCGCMDTTMVEVIVDAVAGPVIECPSTLCPGDTATYYTTAPCTNFIWSVTGAASFVPSGNSVFVTWGSGPLGTVTLNTTGCTPSLCPTPSVITVPIVSSTAAIDGATVACEYTTETYELPKFDGTQYTWDISPPSGGTVVSGENSHEADIQWNAAGTYTINVNYWSKFLECGGTATLTVVVKPSFFVYGPETVCENDTTQITAFPTDNYTWTATGGTIISGIGSVANIVWNTGAGNHTVTAVPVNPNTYCNNSEDWMIEVFPAPAPPDSISGPNMICANGTYSYTAWSSMPGGLYHWTAQNGTVSPSTGNPVTVTWGASGPYSLSAAVQSSTPPNCTSDTTTLQVYPVTSLSITGNTSACTNQQEVYSTTNVPGEIYTWTVSPPTAGSVVVGHGTSIVTIQWNDTPTTASVQVSACGLNALLAVTLNQAVTPVINIPANFCPGATAVLTTTPAGYTAYAWSNASGTFTSAAANPSISSAGAYAVTVTDGNGCTATAIATVHADPAPNASISTPDNRIICVANPHNVTLHALVNPNYSYQWFCDNGTTTTAVGSGPTYTHIGTAALGSFSYWCVVTDVTNGCTATSNALNIIHQTCGGGTGTCTPVANSGISFTVNMPVCNPVSVNNTSVGGSNFVWNWDDLSTSSGANPPPHTYTQAGFYRICLTGDVPSTGGGFCTLTHCESVEVPLAPDFDFTVGCAGGATQFTDLSTHTTGSGIASWFWDFGDTNTSSSTNPSHTYTSPGTYVVTLTIANSSCTASIQKNITIFQPLATFTIPTTACVNNSVAYLVSGSGGVLWDWDFGDGSFSSTKNPFHAYAATGTYTVTLTETDIYGCTNTTIQTINVIPEPSGTISASALTFCQGDFATLTAPSGTAYLWNTGATTQNIIVTHSGDYSVVVTDVNGCVFITPEVTIVTDPIPPAYIIPGGTIDICAPNGVLLYGPNSTAYTYSWNSGQTTNSIFVTAAGTYILTVTDPITGCTNTSLPVTVDVHTPPAAPVVTPSGVTNFCEGESVDLCASHGSLTNFVWSTGATSPCITVTETGYYEVQVTDANGCSAFAGQWVQVDPLPDVCIVPSGCYTICETDTLCIPDIFAGYQWLQNGAPIAGANTNVYFPNGVDGLYSLILTNSFGCIDTSDILDLTFVPCDSCQVSANFSFVNTGGNSFNFTDLSVGNGTIIDWSWDFGDFNTSTLQNPSHTYATAGVYPVCLTVTNVINGDTCVATICKCVIIEKPCCDDFVNEVLGSQLVCDFLNPTFLEFYPPSLVHTADWIDWDFNCDGIPELPNSPPTASVTHNYGTSGNFVLCMTAYKVIGHDTCKVILPKPVFIEENCEEFVNETLAHTISVDMSSLPNVTFYPPANLLPSDLVDWDLDCDGIFEVGGLAGNMPWTTPVGAGFQSVCMRAWRFLPNDECMVELSKQFTVPADDCCVDLGMIDPDFPCPEDENPVCGCDGETYPNECYAQYFGGVTNWTPGPCCVDESIINTTVACLSIYDPVCGCDGVTYANACVAQNYAGLLNWTSGECGCTCDPVIFEPAVSAGFSISGSNNNRTFTPSSLNSCDQVDWRWGDGSPDASSIANNSISHTFSNIGEYQVCMFVTRTTADGTSCQLEYCEMVSITGISIVMKSKALLEGAFNNGTGGLNTTLNENGLVPLEQPFNRAPWNYEGTEAINTVEEFPAGFVDWILVELRDADDPMIVVEQRAGFLLDDGNIADVNGYSEGIDFYNIELGKKYYIVFRHRNHLAIMSGTPVTLPNTTAYNFSSNGIQAAGSEQMKEMGDGIYALHCGDFNSDGVITVTDFNLYSDQAASINQYLDGDANLDGNVTVSDFNCYQPNSSKIGILEIRY